MRYIALLFKITQFPNISIFQTIHAISSRNFILLVLFLLFLKLGDISLNVLIIKSFQEYLNSGPPTFLCFSLIVEEINIRAALNRNTLLVFFETFTLPIKSILSFSVWNTITLIPGNQIPLWKNYYNNRNLIMQFKLNLHLLRKKKIKIFRRKE